MKKRYWVVSPNVSNKPVDEPIWKKIITEKNIAFMGWYEDHDLGNKFKNEIRKGDYILIAQGGNQNKRLFIGGIVSTDAIWEIYPNTPAEAYNRSLTPCLSKIELEKLNLNFTNSAFGAAGRIPSLYELHPNRNDADKKIVDRIELALKIKIQKQNMQEKIELLEYKKQIILQGPPGTGKTRLAKLLAEKMTSTSKVLNPVELIDGFLKNFDTKSPEVLTSRTRHEELLNEFQSKFPIASLKDISKENYCIGTGSNDSFCWWIERGLISLGYYFPGSARSYLIFWSKSKNEYSKHGLAVQIEDDDEAAKRIGLLIADLLEDKNVKLATTFLGTSFLLKILHSYYPEKYFPVNSIPCLENILKLFGENYSSLNGFEKNLKVQELFTERKKALGSNVTSIEFMQFLFGNFDLKGKIEIKTNQIISRGEYKIIQFHPSYSYEDFVRGIAAKTNSDNKVFYKVEDRILMEFAKEAFNNSKSKYVLILDEINRANLSSVLGELIYALEYRYNHIKDNIKEASVESLYDISEDDEESNRVLILPDNLYIIGTMNTADRSVGHIDYAIRRRFAFVDVLPEIEPIRTAGKDKFKTVCELFIEDYDTVDWSNPKFKPSKHISSEFKPEDVMIGHSYFITKEKDDDGKPLDEIKQMELKLKYEIVPILKEYVKDGILKQSKEIETLISSL